MNKKEINFDLHGIGSRLKAIRKELNLKQTDLAQILSTTVVTLSDIETGKKKPSIDVLFILSELYRVNPLYLLHGEGDMFCRKGAIGVVIEENLFGDYTEDVKEMLWYMQNSKLARSAVITMAKEYFYKHDTLLKIDIEKHLAKQEKKD